MLRKVLSLLCEELKCGACFSCKPGVQEFENWDRHLAQQLRRCLGCLQPTSECLGLSTSSAVDSSFLLVYTWEAVSDGSSTWPCSSPEDLD